MESKKQVVPAEVLKVEDRVFGPLTWSQLGILSLSLILATSLLLLPPLGDLTWWKIGLGILIAAFGGFLSLRIKNRLVLEWLIIIFKYNRRPLGYFTKGEQLRR